jgi:hypothetical protein
MNLREAQETVMPWGVHKGKTLREINAAERSYLTEFLRGALVTSRPDAWLLEAVDLVIAVGAAEQLGNDGQGELFGGES